MYWRGRRDRVLLHIVIYGGGRRGWFCKVLKGLTLFVIVVCLRVRQVALRDSVICVGESNRELLHVVTDGGNKYG